MRRVHRNSSEGKRAYFTNESKFTEKINTRLTAEEALKEGQKLRTKLFGKRILEVKPL